MRESKKPSSAKTAVPVTPHQRPVILYVGYEAHVPLRRRRLDGILRCAKSHGWEVATLAALESDPATVRKTIKQLRPVGCIVECWYASHDLPPAFFGAIPVVYFNPPDCALKRHGQRICARGGKVAKKKARVAVARKLAVLMLAMLKSRKEYDDSMPVADKRKDGGAA